MTDCLWDDIFSDNAELERISSAIQLLEAKDDASIEFNPELELLLKQTDYKNCPNCHIPFIIDQDTMICEQCGSEQRLITDCEHYSQSYNQNYNSNENGYISFNITGKNSYGYRKCIYQHCGNSKNYRNSMDRKKINSYVYQYEGNKVPKDVLEDALQMYNQIRDAHHIYRSDGRKGVLGACIFYACIAKHITKTPRGISAMLNIEDKFSSRGEKILQALNEKGVISIPTDYNPYEDYVNQYFLLLGIDTKYKKFILDLINRAEKVNIHIILDSRPTTKCAGCIYMLVSRVKALRVITKEDIVRECHISKSTFLRYYNLLMKNHKKIKPVFKRNGIPMPLSWKN